MNQKKKACRAGGLGSDSGLDLAISRLTNSLDVKYQIYLPSIGFATMSPGAAVIHKT
jgi:hypothetical protein